MTLFVVGIDMTMFYVSTLSWKNGTELLFIAVRSSSNLQGFKRNNLLDLHFETVMILFNTAKHG